MNSSRIVASSDGAEARTLFIPGPTWVDNGALAAMSGGMMGHRSPEFRRLYDESQPVLRKMAGTARPVYLATCSSWGMMEASLRNLVRPGGKVLACCCGAFSDRWYQVALNCGFEADALRVPWGQSIEPDMLRNELRRADYDLVTLVHAETSTGVMNPLADLSEVVAGQGKALLAVDAVSSYSAVPLEMDGWGVDVMLAGTQKALALPPGMTVCAVSERALERAALVPGRGFYFDFTEYERQARNSMTISTPDIPLVMGLAYRAGEIGREGLLARFERHERCCRYVREWFAPRGWTPLAAPGRRMATANCLVPPDNVDILSFVDSLRTEYGFVIDPGYGELKGKCIRISNMGVLSEGDLDPLLEAMDQCLA